MSGVLQSMGSQRVGQDLMTEQQQFIIYLAAPGLSYGQRNLVP